MSSGSTSASSHDAFRLGRFLSAQEGMYEQALRELRTGRKRSHWMWFIFPQIDGLGQSETAKRYSIKSIEEARAYLDHPVLGARLVQCAETVHAIKGRSVSEIFGHPDDLKLRSCMTLFARVAEPGSVFHRVLEKHYKGVQDEKTLSILGILAE